MTKSEANNPGLLSIRAALLVALFLLVACDNYDDPLATTDPAIVRDATSYPVYGGKGGRQHAEGDLITPENVNRLKPLWSYHTGDQSSGSKQVSSKTSFEVTPILVDGLLYFCTPYNRVVALDPANGAERWSYDPKINLKANYSNNLVCRGVSYWRDTDKKDDEQCATRIFSATNDTRLFSLDSKTGKPCADFGNAGFVNTSEGPGEASYIGEYHHTSPPAIIGNKVIIGGSVSDGAGTDAPSGVVRAYDTRTGELLWGQDMAPPDYDYSKKDTVSDGGYALATPNVWAPMMTDESLNLVFAPTGNPLPDYFREGQPDMGHYGSSLIAIDADSGEIVWHYQFVHRDFWDFDTPAQPTLFEFELDGETIPAVAQGTKMGFIFILDRRTGESLFPIEERAVPQNPNFPELELSPTQPFPLLPLPVAQSSFDMDDVFGMTPWDKYQCQKEMKSLRFEGMYTPVSTEWTLMYVGNAGGINWGGLSIDQDRQTLVVSSSNLAYKVKLIPRADFNRVKKENPGHEISEQRGTRFGMWRDPVLSPFGIPCNPTPWGVLTGIDLRTGKQLWQTTLGTTRDLAPVPIALRTGTPSIGGPLTTKSGLTFIGSTLDRYLRAFDNKTGEEIWKGRLPASANSTPMSYVVKAHDGSRQQIVIVAAGGHAGSPLEPSDTLIAFALEK
jgi:quinoprotein glucose dehydrogenase